LNLELLYLGALVNRLGTVLNAAIDLGRRKSMKWVEECGTFER
jgi:hypothetical protein